MIFIPLLQRVAISNIRKVSIKLGNLSQTCLEKWNSDWLVYELVKQKESCGSNSSEINLLELKNLRAILS